MQLSLSFVKSLCHGLTCKYEAINQLDFIIIELNMGHFENSEVQKTDLIIQGLGL